MHMQVLRFWGIVTGACLIAAALWIAALGPEAAPIPSVASGAAEAQDHPLPVFFIVRFRGGGPIARAQREARQGRTEWAQRRIEVELRRQRIFAGLCFERFTAGAEDIVLRTCGPVSNAARPSLTAELLSRLRDQPGVAYADVNESAEAQGPPG